MEPEELMAVFEHVHNICSDEETPWKDEDHESITFVYNLALEHIAPIYVRSDNSDAFTRMLFTIRTAVHREVGLNKAP